MSLNDHLLIGDSAFIISFLFNSPDFVVQNCFCVVLCSERYGSNKEGMKHYVLMSTQNGPTLGWISGFDLYDPSRAPK